ncbi:MAG TPA: ABC transporter ATP-binding protein [Pyrinomonadaceae bacterium]|nr:ABC transporter ATP-binding protein [Pyrinomonadaceae bacterium]
MCRPFRKASRKRDRRSRPPFTYARSHKEALRGLTFAVERGEIFGFLGPSGAGKSTTQKILVGLLEGYRGFVRVREKEVATWTADDYERIGVSFEAPNHFLQLTGIENLRYFAALYRGATRAPAAVLEAVGLESDGNRRVGEYSKGMKCRLTIARCLLNNPDLIFLDDPTGGLDPVNAPARQEPHSGRAAQRCNDLPHHP